MVLAAALHQARHTFDPELANPNAPKHCEVYLFTRDFPDYDRRMEAIRVVFEAWMKWDCQLTLAPR